MSVTAHAANGACKLDAPEDSSDFADFVTCLEGPGGGLPQPDCACFDLDGNGDVDLNDFAGFQLAYTG